MSENIPNAPDERANAAEDAPVEYVEEVVVEYVDNRRQRAVLAVLLVLLFLLLIGMSVVVLSLTRGRQAPSAQETPEGIEWVRSIYGWGYTEDTSLWSPPSVAIGPDGTIWTVSQARYIVGFRPDGTLKRLIQPPFGKKEGHVFTLEGIEVDDDNVIYVADAGRDMILEFDGDTGQWLGEYGVEFPAGVAIGPDGQTLGVTSAGGVGVLAFEGDTVNLKNKFGKRGRGATDFDLPHAVEFGPDGTMYVTDTQNRRVVAYTQAGRLLWTTGGREETGSAEATATDAASPFQLPTGITMDGAGRLLVTDAFNFSITALDAKTGAVLGVWGEPGEQDGFFGYPSEIDYDPERDWVAVADTANNRVQILRLPGTGGGALAGVRRALTRPLWVFCLPLLLLVLAAMALAARRRRERREAKTPSSLQGA